MKKTGSDLRVGVAGATGALGKEIVAVLDTAPWRPRELVPLARASSTVPFVSWGDGQVSVDELREEELGALDALFIAMPRAAVGDLVDRAAQLGVRVIDASGGVPGQVDVPLVLPWLNPDVLLPPRPRDVASTPGPAGTLVASVVGAIARGFDVGSASATVMLPASAFGRDAVEELSRQVVALLNGGNPPRKVFPQGLAFDLVPRVGDLGITGWTSDEIRAATEVARLTQVRADVTLVATPLFSGTGATVRIELDEDVLVEDVIDKLREGLVEVVDGVDARKLPRPRKVEGERQVFVSRVRRSLDGKAIELWATMDNLRVSAVAAVGAMALLLDRERE